MNFIKKHFVFFLCLLLSLAALPYGPVAGVIVGFFGDFIFQRLMEEKTLRKAVEDPHVMELDEPFPGCSYVCALGVYCCGDADAAAAAAGRVFGKKYNADWKVFCRAALTKEGVNGDLLTECTASFLLKAQSAEHDNGYVRDVFEFLRLTELNWNENRMSEKPSVYLGNLLNYRCLSDELEEAYRTMGLEPSAGLNAVKKAHRKLAASLHPDRTGDAQAFDRMQKAYELILESV